MLITSEAEFKVHMKSYMEDRGLKFGNKADTIIKAIIQRGGCPCNLEHPPCPCPDSSDDILKKGKCHCGLLELDENRK